MKKRLCLSRENKMIAGVCGGIADYFNIDVAIIRILWVASAFISTFWPLAIAYIICWAVMPQER